MVYFDTVTIIYTIERYPSYFPLLEPIWRAAKAGSLRVVSSELALLETLVGPLKTGDASLIATFESALLGTDISLLPITQAVLREAARLRATTRLRTPDALHAATASLAGCSLFITNDAGFRGISGLPLTILDDLLSA
jgi:predicted nucleic acid-binding protein